MMDREDGETEEAAFDDSVLRLPDGSTAPFVRVEKRFACPVAGCVRSTVAAAGTATVLASKVGLIEHLREKHGWSHYERYRCDFAGCLGAFAFKAKLLAHQVTHDKPKRDEVSARKKAQADEARAALGVAKHSKTVKRRAVVSGVVNGVTMYFCPVDDCNASFTSYYLVNQHRKLRHAEGEMRDPTRPLSPRKEHTHKRQRREGVPTCGCVYCGKACTTAADLTDHYTSCLAALCAFDVALPSDDIRACLRLVSQLPGKLSEAWNDLFGAGSSSETETGDDTESEDDVDDRHGSDGSSSSSGSGSDDDCETAQVKPAGLTKAIACSIVLHRISASGTPLQLRCPLAGCGKIVATCNALQCHARAAHRPKRGPAYACNECGYTNMSQSRLRVHVRDVHGMERPYVCSAPVACAATFKTRGDERKHVATVHADASAAVKCRICEQTFRSMRALANHMIVHAPRKHTCAVCGDAFAFPSKLAKHMRVHPGPDGVFACAIDGCGKTFVLQDQRAWHDIVAHGAPSAQCGKCKALFVSRANMLRHEAAVHVDVPFTPGRSDGERTIWQALTAAGFLFRTEVALGHGLRLDFALCWPDGNMCYAIEYDGAHHFAPSSAAVERAWGFLAQVQRDNKKTRLLRTAGVPLLRFTRRITCEQVIEAVLRGFQYLLDGGACGAAFSDYVMPSAFLCDAAQRVRQAISAADDVADSPSPGSAARVLLLSLPSPSVATTLFSTCATSCTGQRDCHPACVNAGKLEQYAEAALMLFLWHCAKQPDGGVALFDDPDILASSRVIARGMAEFTEIRDVLLPTLCLTATQRDFAACVVAASSQPVSVPSTAPCVRDSVLRCWFATCSAFFSTSSRSPADDLLRHLAAAHGADVTVRCSVDSCTATASCRHELTRHKKASHPQDMKKHADRLCCGVAGCTTMTVFSSWARWFLHMNTVHGAHFPSLLLGV